MSYWVAPMASDMYAYGMLSTVRKRWLEEREREIVQRWLEATTPSIESIVTQVGIFVSDKAARRNAVRPSHLP